MHGSGALISRRQSDRWVHARSPKALAQRTISEMPTARLNGGEFPLRRCQRRAIVASPPVPRAGIWPQKRFVSCVSSLHSPSPCGRVLACKRLSQSCPLIHVENQPAADDGIRRPRGSLWYRRGYSRPWQSLMPYSCPEARCWSHLRHR